MSRAKDESKEGHKIFGEIGINEWYLYSEKYSAFFKWFTQNVTYDTFYRDSEQRIYEDIEDEGQVLAGSELDRELNHFAAELADINVSDSELAQLEADVIRYTDLDDELAQLIEDTKKTSTKITRQMTATQQLNQIQRDRETALVAQCVERAQTVQEHQLANVQRIRDLNRFYAADQLTPVFIHQMGLHRYYQQCDVFVKHLDQYMHSNFRLQDADDGSTAAGGGGGGGDPFDASDSSIDSLPDTDAATASQLEVINFKLYTASVELVRCQMKVAANRSVYRTETLDRWQPPAGSGVHDDGGGGSGSRAAFVAETVELKRLNDEYMAVELENAMDALTFVLRQLASLKVETAAFENTRTKLRRAEQRLAQLRDVQQVVAEDLMNAEFLWLLMQFDLEKLRNRSLGGVLEAYASEARDVARRTEQLQRRFGGSGGGSATGHEPLVGAVRRSMAAHLPHLWQKLGSTEPADVFGLYERVVAKLTNGLRSLRNAFMNPQIALRLVEIDYHMKKLNTFIKDSPFGGLMLHDLKKKNALFLIGRMVREIEARVGDFKANYIKQYMEPMNNNPFVQAKRLLWVWFLTEPKVVLKALKSITAAAKATANSQAPKPTVKAISGIMRHD